MLYAKRKGKRRTAMKNNMWKQLCLIAVVCIGLLALLPVKLANASVKASGNIGDRRSIHWELDEEGTLTVSGRRK